jgi:hypothetical protein
MVLDVEQILLGGWDGQIWYYSVKEDVTDHRLVLAVML